MTEQTDRDREMAFAAITKDGKYPAVSNRTFDEEMLAKILAAAREESRREEHERCAKIAELAAQLGDEDGDPAVVAACRIVARKIRATSPLKNESEKSMDLARALRDRDSMIIATIQGIIVKAPISDEDKERIISDVAIAFNKGATDWANYYINATMDKDVEEIVEILQLRPIK